MGRKRNAFIIRWRRSECKKIIRWKINKFFIFLFFYHPEIVTTPSRLLNLLYTAIGCDTHYSRYLFGPSLFAYHWCDPFLLFFVSGLELRFSFSVKLPLVLVLYLVQRSIFWLDKLTSQVSQSTICICCILKPAIPYESLKSLKTWF